MLKKNMPVKLIMLMCFIMLLSLSNAEEEQREVGNMVLQGIPDIPDVIKKGIHQYQNTRAASFKDWLPNGEGMLITTRFGDTNQFHIVDRPIGARKQITFYDEPVTEGAFSPLQNSNGFLFTKDIGGSEFSQIFWYDMKSRNAEMISDGESVNFGMQWSNSGNQFAFTSTRRNKKDFDVYISNISSLKKAELKIGKGDGYWMVTDWSPNDDKLLVIQYLSRTKSNSFFFDLKTNKLEQINDDKNEAVFLALAWHMDGEKIYAIMDEGKEFKTLALYDIQSKETQYITEDILWDVEEFALNKSRTRAAFTINENGFSKLYILDAKTNQYSDINSLPIGQISSINFHPTKDLLGMSLNTTQTPGDVFALDLLTQQTERWTVSEVGGLDTSLFPQPELITYETFDNVDGNKRKIPAFVYKPGQTQKPLPVMVSIHGGPEGQHMPRFSAFYAYLANEMGIAVIAPNVRGSSGYGKSYLKLDNGYKREDSVKDIGKLLEWIENNPEFDANRVAVFGGSYGGYMVLSSMVHFGDKLKCGVDIVGISNFVTFLENTEEYRRDFRRVEYGDERDPKMKEFLLSISPTTHADKISKPLFVIQGANDPRVPVSESEQMVEKIKQNGGEVWYMLAKDEGHGFKKKTNRDRMTEAVALFLEKNLLDR